INFQEYDVAHRDYKILLAMRSMPEHINSNWRAQATMMLKNSFRFEGNMMMVRSAANAGLSHLIFTDSLLDRINPHRFPEAFFICHQHPLTL
ncbi:hypothetical protein PFISCL1PPCAC_4075, partial [Pristionchus fissidentatus]